MGNQSFVKKTPLFHLNYCSQGAKKQNTNTYIYDWITEKWNDGPPLLAETAYGACGGILEQQDRSYLIVVASGNYNGEGGATQILAANAEKSAWQWTWGPDMPERTWSAHGVVSFDSRHLFFVGGLRFDTDVQVQDTIYRFSCLDSVSCEYSLLATRLNNGRYGAVVMLLPDSLAETFCSEQ